MISWMFSSFNEFFVFGSRSLSFKSPAPGIHLLGWYGPFYDKRGSKSKFDILSNWIKWLRNISYRKETGNLRVKGLATRQPVKFMTWMIHAWIPDLHQQSPHFHLPWPFFPILRLCFCLCVCSLCVFLILVPYHMKHKCLI